jgi:dihydrofolate reductase
MKISIIVAVAKNNVIGGKGKLLITMGHHILMGKTTFESIGHALPGRTNLVLSFGAIDNFPDTFVFQTPEEAIKFAEGRGEQELMIIGGGMVYKHFFPLADKIYLTRVLKDYEGDVTFPKISSDEWTEVSNEQYPESDPPVEYKILVRK